MPNFKNLNGYTVYDEDAHNQINAMKGLYDNTNGHTININTENDNVYGHINYHIYNNVCYGQVYLTIKSDKDLPTQSGAIADGYLPFPPVQPQIAQNIRIISDNNYYEGGSNKVFYMDIQPTTGQVRLTFYFKGMTDFQYPSFYGHFAYPITGYHTSARSKAKSQTKLEVPVEIRVLTDEDFTSLTLNDKSKELYK